MAIQYNINTEGTLTNTTGVHIQLRRDTLANWTSVNPTLYAGEIGLITDQAQYVVGDGSTTFTSLTKHDMDTDISNLANTNLSNITNTAKIAIAHNASPGSTFRPLTFGVSGITYTAISDGWVYICGTQNSESGYVFLRNESSNMEVVSQPTNVKTYEIRAFIPVAKGQTFTVLHSGVDVREFNFIYNIGSESEAS